MFRLRFLIVILSQTISLERSSKTRFSVIDFHADCEWILFFFVFFVFHSGVELYLIVMAENKWRVDIVAYSNGQYVKK